MVSSALKHKEWTVEAAPWYLTTNRERGSTSRWSWFSVRKNSIHILLATDSSSLHPAWAPHSSVSSSLTNLCFTRWYLIYKREKCTLSWVGGTKICSIWLILLSRMIMKVSDFLFSQFVILISITPCSDMWVLFVQYHNKLNWIQKSGPSGGVG
jgi:hypothetical protein